jgi:hypothetical protein
MEVNECLNVVFLLVLYRKDSYSLDGHVQAYTICELFTHFELLILSDWSRFGACPPSLWLFIHQKMLTLSVIGQGSGPVHQ